MDANPTDCAVLVSAATAVRLHAESQRVPKGAYLKHPRTLKCCATYACRCANSSLRHKTLAPLGKLLVRQRGAVAAVLSRRHPPAGALEGVAAQRAWLHWFGRTLLGSLYPGGWEQGWVGGMPVGPQPPTCSPAPCPQAPPPAQLRGT